jgi:cyclophilin family peptidyl-prolyl cis-trans isomerase
MSNIFSRRILAAPVLLVTLLFSAAKSSAQYTNGIYAEFNTSMGSFTCTLYYAESPKAVASFIGLATGQRTWLDLPAGIARTNPFYNGLTFHRVITNFVIQAGSPNGLGTDGPGYAFVDEITNTLQFNKFGVLAMANSGPDSNGSQFFVLATNASPSLNNGYTIFGQLFGGSNVVAAINLVPTDASNKPLTNVYLNNINIRRIGIAADAFDITAQALPVVTNLNLTIARADTNVSLTFSNRLYADNRLYNSTNLVNWTANQLGIETAAPVSNTNVQNILALAQFFRAAQIQYAGSTFAPKSLFGKTFTLFYATGLNATNILNFNSSGGGTYAYTTNAPGTILGYIWHQFPYNGQIVPIRFSGLYDQGFSMHFNTATTGTFNGGVYPFGYPVSLFAFAISGTFTNSP